MSTQVETAPPPNTIPPFEASLIVLDPVCSGVPQQGALDFLYAHPLFPDAQVLTATTDCYKNREMIEIAVDKVPTLVAVVGRDAVFRSIALGVAQGVAQENTTLLSVGVGPDGLNDTLVSAMLNGEADRGEPPQLFDLSLAELQEIHFLELLVRNATGAQTASEYGLLAAGFGVTHELGAIDYDRPLLSKHDRQLLREVARGEHRLGIRDALGVRRTLGQDVVNGPLFAHNGHRRNLLLGDNCADVIEPLDAARLPTWVLGRRSGSWPSLRDLTGTDKHRVRILDRSGAEAYVDGQKPVQVERGSTVEIGISTVSFYALVNVLGQVHMPEVPVHAHLDALRAEQTMRRGLKT